VIRFLLSLLVWSLRVLFMSRGSVALENRTLREEVLDHSIFLSARNILRVCREYVNYYNGARPSQATHAIPDPYPELRTPPLTTGRVIAVPVLGGVQHDYRRAA